MAISSHSLPAASFRSLLLLLLLLAQGATPSAAPDNPLPTTPSPSPLPLPHASSPQPNATATPPDASEPTAAAAAAATAAAAEEEAEDDEAGAEADDDAGSCLSWAALGECILNPQYMFSACEEACDNQTYADAEADCAGWAANGECERNAGFMIARCNASCVAAARRSLLQPQAAARRNPHLLEEAPSSRALVFLPVFAAVLAAVLAVGVLSACFAAPLARAQERVEERVDRAKVRLQRRFPSLAPLLATLNATGIGSAMICLYYINEGLTVLQTNPLFASLFSWAFHSDGVWQHHVAWLDATNLAGAAAALLCLLRRAPTRCAYVMMADTLVDSYLLLWRIVQQWAYGHGLYVNELMAKKFSLLGCVAMMMASQHQAKERPSSFSGLLLEGGALSQNLSVAVLIGRLLIASLFLYVGLHELHRLLFEPFTPYLPGDGHDVVWPKAVELLLAIPFILGFETAVVARMLSASLVLEAFYAWAWWTTPGDGYSFAHHRRAIHYREHFVTNLATAGGLLLLQKLGAGKYSVDELLKKQD